MLKRINAGSGVRPLTQRPSALLSINIQRSTIMAIDWSKVDRPEFLFERFPSRRSVVYGTKGMVACSQPLAAEAGLEILRRGGNACDAAVATSAALNVTEPSCCGIGG
jgi:gamma-glutamyltranspeptidase/glutathione hydrolase